MERMAMESVFHFLQGFQVSPPYLIRDWRGNQAPLPSRGGEMVYEGGADEWKAKWVKAINDKAGEVTTENVMEWIGPAYQLAMRD